jgi:hypothetical protein
MFVKFFIMEESLFHQLCEQCKLDADCVEREAKKLGFTYIPVLDLDLKDYINFEYPGGL